MKSRFARLFTPLAVIFAACCAIGLTCERAFAQGGVDEILSPQKLAHKDTGYRDGFYFQTEDDNYRLQIQGHFQARFTYNFLEKAPDTYTFAVQRGEIDLFGNVMDRTLKYFFEMNLATKNATTTTAFCTNPGCTTTANGVTSQTSSGVATLNDFYMDWVPVSQVGVRFGQYKVPYLIQELTSPMRQQFVDRSLATGVFDFVRDIGVAVHGDILDYRMNYSAFVMNGEGQNNLNANKTLLTGLRLEFSILGVYRQSEADVDYSETPNFGVGLAYAYNKSAMPFENGTIPAGVAASHVTIDSSFKYKGFSAQVAGMVTHTHTGPSITNWGYYGQVGYFIIPRHFEIAARADGVILKGAPDQYEYTVALNYYIKGHPIKFQTDYSYLMNVRGQGLNDHRIRTQMSILF